MIEIHGDWSEIVNTFGMMGWNHVARPCFCCTTDVSRLYDLDTINALEWPFELTTAESYESACQRAEIWVWVKQRDLDAITPLLYYRAPFIEKCDLAGHQLSANLAARSSSEAFGVRRR